MPYSYISHSRNGRALLDYILKTESHNKDLREERNELISSVGLLPDSAVSYYDQFEWYRKKASHRNLTEMRHIIVSFSEKEVPP